LDAIRENLAGTGILASEASNGRKALDAATEAEDADVVEDEEVSSAPF
jgi:hypothetical protein